tara:strand:- start:348 stop:926 length:579 start_codon:yes stop_codon:yes gene_type:complete
MATQVQQFKYKDIDLRYTPEGDESYTLEVYPKYGQGWSQYPISMFLRGDSEERRSLYEVFTEIQEGNIINLEIVSGKTKQGKSDDGQFGSYFWNVAGFANGATPSPPGVTPAALSPVHPVVVPDARDASIKRQVAMKSAYDYGIANGMNYRAILAEVAEANIAWLEGQVPVEPPTKQWVDPEDLPFFEDLPF